MTSKSLLRIVWVDFLLSGSVDSQSLYIVLILWLDYNILAFPLATFAGLKVTFNLACKGIYLLRVILPIIIPEFILFRHSSEVETSVPERRPIEPRNKYGVRSLCYSSPYRYLCIFMYIRYKRYIYLIKEMLDARTLSTYFIELLHFSEGTRPVYGLTYYVALNHSVISW